MEFGGLLAFDKPKPSAILAANFVTLICQIHNLIQSSGGTGPMKLQQPPIQGKVLIPAAEAE